jgi:predicted nucleic acid-binding Zn ribbon protein
VKRRSPRPLAAALAPLADAAAPATTLARVQGCWESAAGPAVAAEAEPVSERDGVVTVRCSSSVWAHELSLLGPQLVARLDGALGAEGPSAVRSLRFVTGTSEPR